MRIDYYLFGYRKIRLSLDSKSKAATALLRRGLCARISFDGVMTVSEAAVGKYKAALAGVEYEISETLGLFGFLKKNRYRFGAIAGILLCLLLLQFSGSRVWDVRIEGNEQLPKSVIEKALENVGVAPGVGWGSFKVSDKELEFLESTPEIGWVNINRRGVVAYVTVKERNLKEDSSEPLYSNVVSAYDCVIEEITVTSGVAVVKAGDTVRRGDLLISGVIPAELGGGFVAARGEVFGRMREEISVSVSRTEEKTVYERAQISEMRLKIFSFLINIYKKYGNLDKNYVIIEEEIGLASPSGHRLPFKVYKTYREYVSKKEVSYTDDELVSITGERLVGKRAAALVGAELISISTSGDFTDEGYSMSCRMTLLRNIGEIVGITEDEGKK